jgi:hypothetical protein
MSSLLFILLCFWGGLITHLWFYSDFWTFYVKVFNKFVPKRLYQWLLIEEYLNNQDPDYMFDSYIEYLYLKRGTYTDNFIIKFILKLFSCNLCFTFWISILICLIMNNFLLLGLTYFFIRFIDFILKIFLKKQIA